jgi:hypothetical protein
VIIRVFLILLITTLLVFNCSLEPVVIDPETIGDYYLFCTLAPTYSNHQLILGKSLPEILPEQITDATVVIKSENQTITMQHAEKGRYLDEMGELLVEPGEKYLLEVFRGNERIISGETQVPGPFSITSPCKGDTIQLNMSRTPADTSSLPLIQWTTSEHAKYYTAKLDIESEKIWGSFHNTYRKYMYLPDILPSFSYNESVQKEIVVPTKLYVFARDSSFSFLTYNSRRNWDYQFLDYTREQSEESNEFYPFSFDSTKVKMTGALGAFSSINAAQILIYLKIHIDWTPN